MVTKDRFLAAIGSNMRNEILGLLDKCIQETRFDKNMLRPKVVSCFQEAIARNFATCAKD